MKKQTAPFVGSNPWRSVGYMAPALFIAVLQIGDGFLCVEHQIGIDQVVVFAAKAEDFSWGRYVCLNTTAVAPLAEKLRAKALECGATPEAIMLLGTVIKLSTEESTTMAQANPKLNKQAAAPTKGNSAALAKAREARAAKSAGPDTRKVTVLKKDHGARAGSKTAERYDKIIKSKTVQAGLDNTDGIKLTGADFKYAADKGVISLA